MGHVDRRKCKCCLKLFLMTTTLYPTHGAKHICKAVL